MKYNVWDKKTREWIGVSDAGCCVPSEYIAELIEEHEYPKCPEADGWFIVTCSSGGPVVRRRNNGQWYYFNGKQVSERTQSQYTVIREIDPIKGAEIPRGCRNCGSPIKDHHNYCLECWRKGGYGY